MGAGLMGGKSLEDLFTSPSLLQGQSQSSETDTVIILENDLFRRGDEKTVNTFLSKAKHVISIDHLINATSSRSEVALPAATFSESDGTLVNNEGRAQRFYQVFSPNHDVRESWKWIRDIITTSGRNEAIAWNTLDDIATAVAAAFPVLKPIQDIAPRADFRISGQKVPRQPHRYSGRTAVLANITMHEPKPPDDPDSPLSFSMEGSDGLPPAPLVPRYWSPGWNSVQALNKFQQEVAGPLKGGAPAGRLIEPSLTVKTPNSIVTPEAFRPKTTEWLIVSLFEVFGSEELSMLSPGIAERAPKPYALLNSADASRIGVQDADMIEVLLADMDQQFKARIVSDLPAGTVGLYAGTAMAFSVTAPVYCKIKKVSSK